MGPRSVLEADNSKRVIPIDNKEEESTKNCRNARSARCDAAPSIKSTPLLPTKTKSLDQTLAAKLHAILTKHRKIMRNADMSKWAEEFQLLLQERSESEIKSILNWYDIHIVDQYTPIAYSARTFREKFANLERAMFSGTGSTDNKSVIIVKKEGVTTAKITDIPFEEPELKKPRKLPGSVVVIED